MEGLCRGIISVYEGGIHKQIGFCFTSEAARIIIKKTAGNRIPPHKVLHNKSLTECLFAEIFVSELKYPR